MGIKQIKEERPQVNNDVAQLQVMAIEHLQFARLQNKVQTIKNEQIQIYE